MVHLRLEVPCHPQLLLKDHHLSSGSITLTPAQLSAPFSPWINSVPISAFDGINYVSLIGSDASLVPENQLMSICHQSSWCPPERLVTAAPVETGAGKVGRRRKNSWGVLSLEDRLSCNGCQASDLEGVA